MTALKNAQLNELITTDALKKFNNPDRLSISKRKDWFSIEMTDTVTQVTETIVRGHFNSLFSSIFSIF